MFQYKKELQEEQRGELQFKVELDKLDFACVHCSVEICKPPQAEGRVIKNCINKQQANLAHICYVCQDRSQKSTSETVGVAHIKYN